MSIPIPTGLAAVISTYGNPAAGDQVNPQWYAENVVLMDLPYRMVLAWDKDQSVRRIPVHKLAAPDLKAILTEIWAHLRLEVKKEHGFDLTSEQYDQLTARKARRYGVDLFGGAYNYRVKRGGTELSMHAYGVAIDLDPERNAMGDTTPAMPKFVVEAFERRGWVWGGRWKGRNCDGMHFQRARGA